MPEFNFSDGLSEDWVSSRNSIATKAARPSIAVLRANTDGASHRSIPPPAKDSLARALTERSPSQLNAPGSHASTPNGTVQYNEAGKAEEFMWRKDKLGQASKLEAPQDLFSSIGLEKMFKPPTVNTRSPKSRLPKSARSPAKEGSVFPSSPPVPIAAAVRSAELSHNRKSSLPVRTGSRLSTSRPDVREAPRDSKDNHKHRPGDNNGLLESQRPQNSSAAEPQEPPARQDSRVFSKTTNESFSLIDLRSVRINRASIDAASQSFRSNMETRGLPEQARPSSRLSDNGVEYGLDPTRDGQGPGRENGGRNLKEQHQPKDDSIDAQALKRASGFVTVRRGGYSSDDSFRRKPLSPSSFQQFSTPTLPQPTRQAPIPSQRMAESSQPGTPQGQLLMPEGAARSSGSPLKLFDQYDTFTNNHLTRRISQFQIDEGPQSLEANAIQEDTLEGQESLERSELLSENMDAFGNGTFNDFSFTHRHSTPQIGSRVTSGKIKIAAHNAIRTGGDDQAPLDSGIKIGKRQQRSPQKTSDAKRRRTINKSVTDIDVARSRSWGSRVPSIDSIAGKKRRDAKYEDTFALADPETLAARPMLLPRASSGQSGSLSQATGKQEKVIETGNGNVAANMIRVVQSSFGAATEGVCEPTQVTAVLTRKRSVATADFFKEVQQVMQNLRQRVQPMNALSESNDHPDARALFLETVEPFSRPPSREYPVPLKEQEEMDSVIVHHLNKFKDSDELGLALGSSIKAVRRNSEGTLAVELPQSDPPNIRIVERSKSTLLDRNADEEGEETQHASHKSSSSGAQTTSSNNTRSSGSSRLKTVISPDKVSHLISEHVGKMTFDPTTLRWVKRGSASKSHGQVSSDPSEEDPLKEIPDLAVDGDEKLLVTKRVASQSEEGISQEDADENTRASNDTTRRCFPDDIEDSRASFARLRPSTETPPSPISQLAARQGETLRHKRAAVPVKERNVNTDEQPLPLASLPSNSRKPSKMRNVMFSSPPEILKHSSQHNPEIQARSLSMSLPLRKKDKRMSSLRRVTANEPKAEEVEGSPQAEQNSLLVRAYPTPESGHQRRSSGPSANVPPQESMALKLIRPAAQHTPPPKSNDVLRVALNSSVGFHLSPLPSFTIHQADESLNLDADYIAKRQGLLSFNEIEGRFSLAVERLVSKITDVEPNEPFWEYIRKLSLAKKDLLTLHMLDEFCPRVEELDVSSNQLGQINGAPLSLRSLSVRYNCLSSLTAWGHLHNLQYLDVSGNRISSLKAFSPLVHLRELIADDNQIQCLEGVVELDGLLKLGLARNSIRNLDFEGSNLSRLVELDGSENGMEQIIGLDQVPSLEILSLRKNHLREVPSAAFGSCSVVRLDLSLNDLESIDVSHMKRLAVLNLDENRIASIKGLSSRSALRLSWRNQALDGSQNLRNIQYDLCKDTCSLSISNNQLPLFAPQLPFWSLRRLELACSGVQELCDDFGQLIPNVRVLNLNYNALKDLAPLVGVDFLEELHVAGNRIHRLRRTATLIRLLGKHLHTFDCRDNPITLGYYAPASSKLATEAALVPTDERGGHVAKTEPDEEPMSHIVLPGSEDSDARYLQTLDKSTSLRRQVYQTLMLLAGTALTSLDGLPARREKVAQSQGLIRRLVELGVLHRRGQPQSRVALEDAYADDDDISEEFDSETEPNSEAERTIEA